jgi:hypothetical protein
VPKPICAASFTFNWSRPGGGRADTAVTLRGTCALGLADCELDDVTILTYLADA